MTIRGRRRGSFGSFRVTYDPNGDPGKPCPDCGHAPRLLDGNEVVCPRCGTTYWLTKLTPDKL